MLEQRMRMVSESLARAMDRRGFIKRTGTAFAAGMMALASGHALVGLASAQNKQNRGEPAGKPAAPNSPMCVPPGPFCNLNGDPSDPNGCHGARCYQHRFNGLVYACNVFYTFYAAGCWTNASGGGYWTCCDCQCGNGGTCGCAQFSLNPVPNPD
jgi:hypothetical protein